MQSYQNDLSAVVSYIILLLSVFQTTAKQPAITSKDLSYTDQSNLNTTIMSTQPTMGPCCLSGTLATGTPAGTEDKIAGLPTYIARPSNGSNAKTIIFLPDGKPGVIHSPKFTMIDTPKPSAGLSPTFASWRINTQSQASQFTFRTSMAATAYRIRS